MKTIDEGRDLDDQGQWLGAWRCRHCLRTLELEPGDDPSDLSDTGYDGVDVSFVPYYRPEGSIFGTIVWSEGMVNVRCHNCHQRSTWVRAKAATDDVIEASRDTMTAPDREPADAGTG